MTGIKHLGKREKEVAELLLQGKSNKQIALGITESTVEFHLKNLYAKLQVSSRAGAISKLGKSTGLIADPLRESIVEKESEIDHTSGTFISENHEVEVSMNSVSMGKGIEMKTAGLPVSWQDWAALFPKLILFKFLKWKIVGAPVGGLAGLVTSRLYSIWIEKTNPPRPA
jgi:DNA-binding CsgD family transcriptional regulator